MRFLIYIIIFYLLQSCAKNTYTDKHLLPEGIKSLTEETYVIEKSHKKLIRKKELILTNNGRVKTSKTSDSLGNFIQETEKRMWFVKESNSNTEPYYCKTRWKPNNRERISCYTQKRDKKNESIYHYNKDGSIHKIVDNFTNYHTHTYSYVNNKLFKIITNDKDGNFIDEIQITCEEEDDRGLCLKQLRISRKETIKIEVHLTPIYH